MIEARSKWFRKWEAAFITQPSEFKDAIIIRWATERMRINYPAWQNRYGSVPRDKLRMLVVTGRLLGITISGWDE